MALLKASGYITNIYLSYRHSPIKRSAVPISVPYFNHYVATDSCIRVSEIRHHLQLTKYRQNDTYVRFQCRSTKKKNVAETEPMKPTEPGIASVLGVARLFKWFSWMLFFLLVWKLFIQPNTGAFSNISKFIPKWAFVVSSLFISFVLIEPQSKKKEPENVSFDDLVGVNAAKVELQVISSILQGNIEHKRRGAKLPDGVLLYGPTGTGKTTLVHALAREAKVSFFPVSAMDIGGALGTQLLFTEARMYSPSIVFIKDVDAVLAQKGNRKYHLLLSELYSEMEKCKIDRSGVLVITATKRLDPILMRYGRSWKEVHVSKPDIDCTRKFVGLCLKKVLREDDKEAVCNFVASQTEGLVWDDLKNIADEATRLACRRGDKYVTVDDVRQALRMVNHNIYDVKGDTMVQENMQHC